MEEANEQIAYLMEKLREEPRKSTLHMKKIMEKFRKQDKVNAETIQANLVADFQRIAIKHHEEDTKLVAKQRDYMDKVAQELLTVGEPMPIAQTHYHNLESNL